VPTFLLLLLLLANESVVELAQPIPPTATTARASAATIPCIFLRLPRGRRSRPAKAAPDGIAQIPVFFNSLELKALVLTTSVAVPGFVPSSVIFAGVNLQLIVAGKLEQAMLTT